MASSMALPVTGLTNNAEYRPYHFHYNHRLVLSYDH